MGAAAHSLTFRVWYDTEGGTFDGWNVKISSDGGASFTLLTTVTPDYELTISAEQSLGGNKSANGWMSYGADLSGYAGQDILLQFAIRTDGSAARPGVYIDDVTISS